MTATLYLVRHGRTSGNGHCYMGWQDLELDATGLAQARAAGSCLAQQRLDAVHASPLQRARATAEALRAPHPGLPLALDERLRELHYGEFTGRDKREYPLRLRRNHLSEPVPGGESLAQLGIRVQAYVQDVLVPALQRGESVAVVAHFWSLRQLLAALRGQDLPSLLRAEDYHPETGSVYALAVTATAAGWRGGNLVRLGVADPDAQEDWEGGRRPA
jgi:broad specificity phosphatase PhoE